MKKQNNIFKDRVSKIVLKILQSNQQLTQSDLANLLGVSNARVSSYLSGKEMPRIEILMRIAELAEITVDDLLKGSVTDVGPIIPSKSVVISMGKKSIAAGRDVYVHQKLRKVHEFVPGPDNISAEQASRLKILVDQIVDYELKTMKRPKSHAAVWSIFKRQFKVAYYRELNNSKFYDAERYLVKWVGRLRGLLRNVDTNDWRKERIKAIQTKRKKYGWLKEDFTNYLLGKYNHESLKDLNDDQLEEFYKYIFS